MKLDGANIATIIVAVVGLLGMWLSQRISARASTQNQRTLAEVEAYARAIKMERETNDRQAKENEKLVADKEQLKKRVEEQEVELHKKATANTALVRQNLFLQEQLRNKNHGKETL